MLGNEEFLLEELLIPWQGSEECSGPRTRDRKYDMVGVLLTSSEEQAVHCRVQGQAGEGEEKEVAFLSINSLPR